MKMMEARVMKRKRRVLDFVVTGVNKSLTELQAVTYFIHPPQRSEAQHQYATIIIAACPCI